MGLFTNVGGQLKELTSLNISVGGQLKELTSLNTNIGGQLKEILTTMPESIVGTHLVTTGTSNPSNKYLVSTLKLPANRKFKIKITIKITDGHSYRDWGDGDEVLHEAKVLFVQQTSSGESTVLECKPKNYRQTDTTFTAETTFTSSGDGIYNIYTNRWVGWYLNSTSSFDYYLNKQLSFDYSIEFERVKG